MPTTQEPTLLERLHDQRAAKVEEWSKFIDAREKVEGDFEARTATDSAPTAEEITAHEEARTAYRAAADQMEAELKELDKRISDQEDIERRRAEAAKANEGRSAARVTREPMTYERHKAMGEVGVSYYRDLAAAHVPGVSFESTNSADAMARLQRHAKELEVDLPKRAKAKAERAQAQFEEAEGRGERRTLNFDPFRRGLVENPFEQRIEPNSTQGQGGYFIPPTWLVDDFIPGLRAHLVAAALCRQLDLPPGTNSINIPKLANLTTIGYQQMNNAGLPSADWSDTAVQANVKTIGGYSDVALQLLEQSPHQIVDEVVTADLMAAYNAFLDLQVVAGDGLNTSQLNGGHLMGLYPSANWSGTNSVTYTNASLGQDQAYKLSGVLGAMASQIARTRFDAEQFKVVLHGRRWFWYSSAPDGNDRPLGETMSGGRLNVQAAIQAGLQAEGLVGSLPFLADVPVYIDDNVPTTDNTDGGGATRDIAIGALWDDVWLFRGDLRTNVYREILSGSLGVRFQAYAYNAMLVRYGQSLAIATGSGFAPPVGVVSSVAF